MSTAGIQDSNSDFGNGYYSDHHYHGYHMYAAAVIALNHLLITETRREQARSSTATTLRHYFFLFFLSYIAVKLGSANIGKYNLKVDPILNSNEFSDSTIAINM